MGPENASDQALAWKHNFAARQGQSVGSADGHGMEHVRAVRIDDAFGMAGGSGGVTHAAGGVLVELRPVEFLGAAR